MRALLPDLPDFRELSERGEHSVPGVTLDFYRGDQVPAGEADGVVLWFAAPATRTKLLTTPGLKWVLTLTAGIDHVQTRLPPGVILYNANRLHDRAVAVHVVAGILGASRNLHLYRDAQGRREWAAPGSLPESGLTTLDGKTVVLWGYGHIGRNVEDLLRPFGVQVHGIRSDTDPERRDALLQKADWVVLLLPSTAQTRGIVNARTLGLLKQGAWLSNQGRGDLIVQADLLAALQSGQLGGAVLDVTDPEPLPGDSPLWNQPNVIITPHIASSTSDLLRRGAALTRDFLIDMQQGHEPAGRVNPGRDY